MRYSTISAESSAVRHPERTCAEPLAAATDGAQARTSWTIGSVVVVVVFDDFVGFKKISWMMYLASASASVSSGGMRSSPANEGSAAASKHIDISAAAGRLPSAFGSGFITAAAEGAAHVAVAMPNNTNKNARAKTPGLP